MREVEKKREGESGTKKKKKKKSTLGFNPMTAHTRTQKYTIKNKRFVGLKIYAPGKYAINSVFNTKWYR